MGANARIALVWMRQDAWDQRDLCVIVNVEVSIMAVMDRGHHSTWTAREAWYHAYAMARMDIPQERIAEEHGRLMAGWAIEAAHVRVDDPLAYRLGSPWRSAGISGQYWRSLQSGYIMAFDGSRSYRKIYGQYAPR